MTEYDNNNRGQLWGNDKKDSPKHPDFKGSINVDGVEYWLSGWKRKAGANPKAPALSLSISPKDGAANSFKKEQSAADTSFDELPF